MYYGFRIHNKYSSNNGGRSEEKFQVNAGIDYRVVAVRYVLPENITVDGNAIEEKPRAESVGSNIVMRFALRRVVFDFDKKQVSRNIVCLRTNAYDFGTGCFLLSIYRKYRNIGQIKNGQNSGNNQ